MKSYRHQLSAILATVHITPPGIHPNSHIWKKILPCPLTVLVEQLHRILFFLLHPPEQPKHWTFSSFGPYPVDIGPHEFLGKHRHLQNPTQKKKLWMTERQTHSITFALVGKEQNSGLILTKWNINALANLQY